MVIEQETKPNNIALCSCSGFIYFCENGYYKDNTYEGECTECGKKYRGDCSEVRDFINMRGDYAVGGSKWHEWD